MMIETIIRKAESQLVPSYPPVCLSGSHKNKNKQKKKYNCLKNERKKAESQLVPSNPTVCLNRSHISSTALMQPLAS